MSCKHIFLFHLLVYPFSLLNFNDLILFRVSSFVYYSASHNEIAIGIDVMNLILAEQKMDFIPNNPFPFTPGLDHHTYPCHSPPSKDFQFQKYNLMLGMKRMVFIYLFLCIQIAFFFSSIQSFDFGFFFFNVIAT